MSGGGGVTAIAVVAATMKVIGIIHGTIAKTVKMETPMSVTAIGELRPVAQADETVIGGTTVGTGTVNKLPRGDEVVAAAAVADAVGAEVMRGIAGTSAAAVGIIASAGHRQEKRGMRQMSPESHRWVLDEKKAVAAAVLQTAGEDLKSELNLLGHQHNL